MAKDVFSTHPFSGVGNRAVIDVPGTVRNKATAAGALDWLEHLPQLISRLESEWDIAVGAPFSDGTEAFVAEATLTDGGAAVLKLLIPRDGDAARREAIVLRLADGDSCAKLFRDDVSRRIAAHDDERAVLVHGDVHEWNVLQSDEGFKLIDPDGLLAQPEYDLGITMCEDPVELFQGDPLDRAQWLANRCGLDATAIWEWGVAERVSTGLLATKIEIHPVGRQMLVAADGVALNF